MAYTIRHNATTTHGAGFVFVSNCQRFTPFNMANTNSDKRLKRHRVKRAANYLQWQVWTLGADRHLLGVWSAKRSLFRHWLKAYNERLTTRDFVFISLCRHYCAIHGVTFFAFKYVIHWAIKCEYLPRAFKRPDYWFNALRRLESLQFCNPLTHGKHTLTNRAKLLFSLYEQRLKTLFAQNTE